MEAEVECIVKLGGAAVTHKAQLETLNEEALEHLASVLAKVVNGTQKIFFYHQQQRQQRRSKY